MTIQYVIGDATDPIQVTDDPVAPRIIAHVSNDIGKWGRGFTEALDRRWRRPGECFRQQARSMSLGDVQYVGIGDGLFVANMIAQHGVRSAKNPVPLSYGALSTCLVDVAAWAAKHSASVHMPRIGCGLAGGNWPTVSAFIELHMKGVTVVVYDLSDGDPS